MLKSDEDRSVIHAIPIGYKVDFGDVVRDPRGAVGRELAAACQVVSVPSSLVAEVEDLAAYSHLSVSAMVAAPYACGLAVVNGAQSVLVIDIGGRSFSSILFYHGSVMSMIRGNFGSGDITSSMVGTLSVPLDEAERLKRRYGAETPEGVDFSTLVDVSGVNGGVPVEKTLVKAVIMDAVRAAAFLWCAKLREFLTANAFACVDSVVLCGGGATLKGIADIGRTVFGIPCSVAGAELKGVSSPRFPVIRGAMVYMSDRAPVKKGLFGGLDGRR
jgi:cell division protein FtsA